MIFQWLPLVLQISDPASMTSSGEGSQSTSLDDSNKPVEQCEQSLVSFQFAISYCWKIPAIVFLNYLFINTWLLPVILNYNQGLLIIGLYYLLDTNSDLNSITADQQGFESGSSGTKAATLPLCYVPLTFRPFFLSCCNL